MTYIPVADAEDEILSIVAGAQVSGRDPTDEFLSAKQIENDVATVTLIRRGIRSLLRERRSDDRLQMKVLSLDPEYYERIRRRIEERDASPARMRQLKLAAEAQAAKDVEAQKRVKTTRQFYEKLERALAFYESWVLPDGTALGDATREQLVAEATRERTIADGHLKNANFYETLADEMAPGATVREAVSLDRAHRIREDVYASEPGVAA